jgi:O-acetyl-ADP-ribose deacetylase (regulator of RNase III)
MKIEVIKRDITQIEVDAIVNAANRSLLGGGGVDGAIHQVGGKKILAECKEIAARQGGCPPGDAVITTAGDLKAKYVIHAVGPVWRGGDYGEAKLLAQCYKKSLQLAEEHSVKSIAFPNISTGIYGFPKRQAASVAIDSVTNTSATSIERLIFVCFNQENYELYNSLIS